MEVSSFDIFDTCVIRKCGAPKNLFDILSYRVFSDEVSTEQRLEFIACRLAADESSTFNQLYDTFNYTHPLLLSKEEVMQKELDCELEMMVPVNTVKLKIESCRSNGDLIYFISDMYLPSTFLEKSLLKMGIFKEGDKLYVSSDCGYKKSDGSLFHYIKEKENLSFENWHHYGDNPISDIQIPRILGIKTHLVNLEYLPFERNWINNSCNINYHTGEIMAGIGRSIYLSTEPSEHNAFAVDISAPLTTAFALRTLYNAEKQGIRRLYFCSRDCYALYYVAKRLSRLTPSVEPIYFHTSREALFESKEEDLMNYLVSIHLADTERSSGVVDFRSTGNSLRYLNEKLQKHGYKPVFGYYLEMFCSNFYSPNLPPYHCEINRLYCSLFEQHHPILEKFLSICPEKKTTKYVGNNYILSESSQVEDYSIDNTNELSAINLNILCKYADYTIETELYRHCTEMFYAFVIPTLKLFFSSPHKVYLLSLRHLFILQNDGTKKPYIEIIPTGISLKIAQIANNSTIRSIRRLAKLIMRITNIKPLPSYIWWLQGTLEYNKK